MNESNILQKIKVIYEKILGEKLVGIYVHGSIAFGCFTWEKSDIDFLAVVNAPLVKEEKEAIISALLVLDEICPPKGLEMSIVHERVCTPFVYPTPYELHFSNGHKDAFKTHFHAHCEALHGTDKDLAAHFTVTRWTGLVLCGKAIDEVFAEVPREAYLDSILFDVENADTEIEKDPVYFILNLCRVLAFVKDGLVLSKKAGGEWGLANLPKDYTPLIQNAWDSYQNVCDFEPNALLHTFVADMLARIKQG